MACFRSPNAVNARRQITGVAATPDGRTGRAFIWTDGTLRELPTLGGFFTVGVAINDRGQVAGFGYTPDGSAVAQHAFFWDGEAMHDVGALPPLARGESWGLALNDAGQMVGRGAITFLYRDGEITISRLSSETPPTSASTARSPSTTTA